MSKDTEIANIDEMLAKEAAVMKQTLAKNITSDKISTKGGKFKLPTGRELGSEMKAVVLCYIQSNVLYNKAYNPKDIEQPICLARGAINDDDIAPHSDSKEPQSTTCEVCPKNDWGSRGDGSKAKACKNAYTAAVIVPELGDEIYELNISSTAMKDWDKSISAMNETLGHHVKGIAHIGFSLSTGYNRVVITTAEPNPDYAKHAALMDKTKASMIA